MKSIRASHRLLLSLLLLAGAGSAAAQAGAPAAPTPIPQPPDQLVKLLAYDAKVPEIKVVGEKKETGVTVTDVTFAAVAGSKPIEAYIVRPESGAGPFAGVLFVHWFAPPDPTSNRTQFLEEAKMLARKGTVSLLVSTFWSEQARYDARRWETDFQNSVDQTRDLRRALDVLLAQPGVDPKRIGLVGHDYGAMFGTAAAAADQRVKASVFIAGTSRFPNWYLFGSSSGVPKGAALEKFRQDFAQIDPVDVIRYSRAAHFFQFGEADGFTPREDFVSLYMAAPGAKRIATYPAEHEMNLDIIRFDRYVWLAEQLGLPVAKSLAFP